MNVDPVKNRTRDAFLVSGNNRLFTSTPIVYTPTPPAGAGVYRMGKVLLKYIESDFHPHLGNIYHNIEFVWFQVVSSVYNFFTDCYSMNVALEIQKYGSKDKNPVSR